MSDSDISNGELARGIAELKGMLAGLIGRAEYDSDQRGLLYRLDELARDLDRERQDRDLAIAAVHQRITDEGKVRAEHRMTWQTVMLTSIPPTVATLIAALVTYLVTRGGH